MKARAVYLFITLLILIGIGRYFIGDFSFILNAFWFTSGLLLLILLSLIDQPHFSKDSNIFINGLTGFLSLMLLPEADHSNIYYLFLVFCIYLVISSYLLMIKRENKLIEEPKYVQFFSRVNRQIGRPKFLFSAFFLWGAIMQFGLNGKAFHALLLFWFIFISIDINILVKTIMNFFKSDQGNEAGSAIGKIFGVQGNNTLLVRLFDKKYRPSVKKYDYVRFIYSADESNKIRSGVILDQYLLNEEQWIKVLTTSKIDSMFMEDDKPKLSENAIYLVAAPEEDDFKTRFVGVITDNSRIEKIRFNYNSNTVINEGDLIKVDLQNKEIIYQIVEGITQIDTLESKNEFGFLIGEAVQLGVWNENSVNFEKFGWLPAINAPVYKLSNNESTIQPESGEALVGTLPSSQLPSLINIEESITHHTAIIGITGSGKSVFSRYLIRQALELDEIKVISIDLTGEYNVKLADYTPASLFTEEECVQCFEAIDKRNLAIANNFAKESDATLKVKTDLESFIKSKANVFLTSEGKLGLFDLPIYTNTASSLEFTKMFFEKLFELVKEGNASGKKVCLVLEEAHTLVPEVNYAGATEKTAKPLINSICQIALQGRKYGIGFYVIAQRTANVSKTVLTQCNSVITFKVFDKTTIDFMSNYYGTEIASSLSNLQFRQAIVAGQAFRSNIPMIIEVPEINE